MSGPLDVSQTLEENDRVKEPVFILPSVDRALKPWFDFKAKLNERYGFKLGTDYQFVSQWANDSLGEDYAAGGAYRFFFDWNVLGQGASHPGSIIFKTENRHNFSDVAPEAFSTALGYVGLVGTGYGDFGWGVTDLYWKQQFWSDHVVEFRLGRLAPTAYFDAIN